jgi:serine O-acetyltransferase
MMYDGSAVKAWAGDSQWRACRADLARFRANGYSGWGSEGFWALAIFRLQKVLASKQPRWVFAPAGFALNIPRKLLKMITNIDLNIGAEIGPGTLITHQGPIHVQAGTKIGADCAIHHSCTIGAGLRPGAAVIGDHVYVACGASIIGPVKIGDNAVIGANSLVITDVPAGHTAIGVPARSFPPSKESPYTRTPPLQGSAEVS